MYNLCQNQSAPGNREECQLLLWHPVTNQCRTEQVSHDRMWMKQLHYVGTQYVDKDCQTSKFVEKEMNRVIGEKNNYR